MVGTGSWQDDSGSGVSGVAENGFRVPENLDNIEKVSTEFEPLFVYSFTFFLFPSSFVSFFFFSFTFLCYNILLPFFYY